jgi:rhamnulokinase
MSDSYIAIDLGASSGRAVLGTLRDGRLELSEQYRFENGPLPRAGSLFWDSVRLEREVLTAVQRALAAAGGRAAGIGVDSWGVDYLLLGHDGQPLDLPFHYRDSRTATSYGEVCARLGRAEIYRRTGIQFMAINTLYQLAAEPGERLKRAGRLLMIADWLAHRLGGRPVGEVTLASTSQMVDPRTRRWDEELAETAVPGSARLLPELVEAGTRVGEHAGVPLWASAHHDTGAAVAGCPGAEGGEWAFLSSGTWSLLGMELDRPATGPEAMAAGLSNELGVGGKVRLLRNIMGLWILQECRSSWSAAGDGVSWEEITAQAAKAPALTAVIDPDDGSFLSPGGMPGKIEAFCCRTGQRAPEGPGAVARAVLEALALKTALVLEGLESVTGRSVRTLNMIGGGTQNRLLCQLTADASGREVVAGPVEATAAGNVMVQAVGSGAVTDWAEARRTVARSFNLVKYEPKRSAQWEEALGRLRELTTE